MIPGTRFDFQIGYHTESGVVKQLLAELNEDGSVFKKQPRCIGGSTLAMVLITLDSRACMEVVSNFEVYSRVQVLYQGVAVAFGKIIELVD